MMHGDDYEDGKNEECERRQFMLAVERVRKALADPKAVFAYYADWCDTCESPIRVQTEEVENE
jgi:thiol:disulfide interchange protein